MKNKLIYWLGIVGFISGVMLLVVTQSELSNLPVQEYKVMVITKSATSDFWQKYYQGIEAASYDYPELSVTEKAPLVETDVAKQNDYLQEAINEEYQLIIISAIDFSKSQQLIERAQAQGIGIIAVDSDLPSKNRLAFIGTNDRQAGQLAAQEIIQTVGPTGKIGVIKFEENTKNAQERWQSFKEYLVQESQIEIVAIKQSWSNYDVTEKLTAEMLLERPDIQGVVAFNEVTTIGAARALKEHQGSSPISLVGYDTHLEIIGYLEDQTLTSSIAQNPFGMGYKSIQLANDYSLGRKLPEANQLEIMVINRQNLFDEEVSKFVFPSY